MSRAWTIATAVAAVIALAPWAIYLAGLAKLTDVISGFSLSEGWKQNIIMLEWYTVSAQFFLIAITITASIANGLHRCHSFLIMFLAVNAALMIIRATDRIYQINLIDDGEPAANVLGVTSFTSNPLPYLRAEACGQVASSAMNFFLAIVAGLAGTAARPQPAEGKGAPATAV